jgi:hypothetical protein
MLKLQRFSADEEDGHKGLSHNYPGLNDCEIFRNDIYRTNQNIAHYDLIMNDLT